MMEERRWTLGELGARVIASLATDYPGVTNRQARDLPNARAIRWYASLGLLDKPAAWQGRLALYGPRHLMQLVVIKRLQADGLSLLEVQQHLTGRTDAELAAIARVPDDVVAAQSEPYTAVVSPRPTRRGRAFWTDAPVEVPGASMPAPRASPIPQAVQGVVLDDGTTLTFPCPRPLAAEDLEALRAALEPVRDVLRARGLVPRLEEGETR